MPGIGHNQGPPLEAEAEAVAEEANEAGEAAVSGAGTAAAALSVPFLVATTEPLNSGEDEIVAKVNWHHSWPKYLGGIQDQLLTRLPENLHIEYHRLLDEVAPRRKGAAYYDNMDLQERLDVLGKVAEKTKEFDAIHGTHLYEDMLQNGFPVTP